MTGGSLDISAIVTFYTPSYTLFSGIFNYISMICFESNISSMFIYMSNKNAFIFFNCISI